MAEFEKPGEPRAMQHREDAETQAALLPAHSLMHEWQSTTLGRICGRITTGRLDANAMVVDGDYPFFTCARERYSIDRYAFDCEALLVSGNGANVGYVHHYAGKFNAYQRTYVLSEFSANVLFLKLFLEHNLHERIRVEVNAGNTPYITMGTLTEMAIALPTDEVEQRAIAEALGEVDALLSALDRLIDKKRDLKQAAMQQLLTGQTRMPGFSGSWITKRLGNIAPLQRGFDLPSRELKPGPYPVVYSNGILTHHDEFRVRGPGIVTGRSGTIGRVTFVDDSFWPHNTSLWVTAFNGNDPRFVFFLYSRIGFNRFATGSGVPTLNRNDVHAFEMAIPPTLPEQTTIAAVLSDMDAELSALEQRRDKTRALKQGMMQELLTGRIRLV